MRWLQSDIPVLRLSWQVAAVFKFGRREVSRPGVSVFEIVVWDVLTDLGERSGAGASMLIGNRRPLAGSAIARTKFLSREPSQRCDLFMEV